MILSSMAISEQQIKDLEKRIKLLEEYIEKKKIQQIHFPLDSASQKIIIDVAT